VLTQAEYDRRIIYYRIIAAGVGIPPADRDDAAQDMLIRWWQSDYNMGGGFARRAAIDAARRYGPRTRRGEMRTEWLPLVAARTASVEAHDICMRVDLQQAMRNLTLKQRDAIMLYAQRLPMSNLESAHAGYARRRLRRLLSGETFDFHTNTWRESRGTEH